MVESKKHPNIARVYLPPDINVPRFVSIVPAVNKYVRRFPWYTRTDPISCEVRDEFKGPEYFYHKILQRNKWRYFGVKKDICKDQAIFIAHGRSNLNEMCPFPNIWCIYQHEGFISKDIKDNYDNFEFDEIPGATFAFTGNACKIYAGLIIFDMKSETTIINESKCYGKIIISVVNYKYKQPPSYYCMQVESHQFCCGTYKTRKDNLPIKSGRTCPYFAPWNENKYCRYSDITCKDLHDYKIVNGIDIPLEATDETAITVQLWPNKDNSRIIFKKNDKYYECLPHWGRDAHSGMSLGGELLGILVDANPDDYYGI
jgi:hypothetical protein